jgi:hypothetical protein
MQRPRDLHNRMPVQRRTVLGGGDLVTATKNPYALTIARAARNGRTAPIALEPGAPEDLQALAEWLNAGALPDWEWLDWDVCRLVARDLAEWPVGYLPAPDRGAVAMLALFEVAP